MRDAAQAELLVPMPDEPRGECSAEPGVDGKRSARPAIEAGLLAADHPVEARDRVRHGRPDGDVERSDGVPQPPLSCQSETTALGDNGERSNRPSPPTSGRGDEETWGDGGSNGPSSTGASAPPEL